jgi:hypothetical protein
MGLRENLDAHILSLEVDLIVLEQRYYELEGQDLSLLLRTSGKISMLNDVIAELKRLQ